MTATDIRTGIIERLRQLHQLCPDMRFGQMLATIGELADDETGHGLWDVEDDQLAAAMDRFADDLRNRHPGDR